MWSCKAIEKSAKPQPVRSLTLKVFWGSFFQHSVFPPFLDSPNTPNSPMVKRKQRRKESVGGSELLTTPLSASYSHVGSSATSRCEGDVFTFENGEAAFRKGESRYSERKLSRDLYR